MSADEHAECADLLDAASDEIERLRAVVAQVEALMNDPWHGDANWNAVHQTGVKRRGALRGGHFVAVDDLRPILTPKETP